MPITETTVLGRVNCDVNAAGELEIAHYTARSLFTRPDGTTAVTDQPLMVLGPGNTAEFWEAWKAMSKVVKAKIDEIHEQERAAAERATLDATLREQQLALAVESMVAEKE